MKFSEDWWPFQWQTVKAVANNDLSRVMGLVPLAGYLILFNDEFANLASFNTIAGVTDQFDSPFFLEAITKLRLVFFGSLFVFISFVIYRIFRPPVIDFSISDIEFSGRVRENYTVAEIASMELQVYSDSWKPRNSIFWTARGITRQEPILSGFRPDTRSYLLSEYGDYISFLAREWWTGMMHTFRPARIASLVFGVSGYILLAVPTVDIAQAVIRDILTST